MNIYRYKYDRTVTHKLGSLRRFLSINKKKEDGEQY